MKKTVNIVENSLSLKLSNHRKNSCLKRAALTLIPLAIIYSQCRIKYFSIQYAAIIILATSFIYNIARYFYFVLVFEPVVGNSDQKRLLKFEDKDNSFVIKSPEVFRRVSPPKMSINVNSSYNDSASFNFSGILSNASANNSMSNNFTSPYKNANENEDLFTDENALHSYLQNSFQDTFNNGSGLEDSKDHVNLTTSGGSVFWNHQKPDDFTELLMKSIYQLSPTVSTTGHKEDNFPTVLNQNLMDLNGSIEEGKFSSAKLSHLVTNLKKWVSGTILERLVCEINSINNTFKQKGFADLQIGSVGLDRLRKTAENQIVVSHIPIIPVIVPFLELTANQEYLVNRIRNLAKGTCISDYHWNSGSLSWDEHLPTDSAIMFHLFCTYMDSQLLPLPQPGGRPFFNRYVVMGDKKSQKETLLEVKNKAKCAILCTNLIKPVFNFISDKIHDSAPDRNNLFHVLTQFLIYIKNNHDGFIDGVNLGRSGVNILCVLED